ncbi:MAG: hypothetical protein K6G03_09310, partial [Lachnospiraceae bacterium]|nr:hypothetical protein [Lachnospiraceae bacterium]
MTTPNINAAGAMAAGAHEITSGKAKGKAEGQSFMDIMNLADTSGRVNAESSVADLKASRTRQNTPEPQKKEANQIEPKDTGDKNGAVDNKDAKGSRDIRETQETGKTEVSKNNDESNGSDQKITEAAGDVKEAIEAELGISDEEMDQLLEVMGLTTVDLLDPKVITDIVAQVKDVTPVDIVSNEELTDIVSGLQGKVREITSGVMQETDMTMEDFKNAIAEIKKQETGNEVVSGKPREDVRAFDQKILTEDGKELQNTVRTPAEAVSPERADDHQGRTGRISDEREVSLDVSVKN